MDSFSTCERSPSQLVTRSEIPPYEFVVSDPRGSGVLRVMATGDDDEPLEVIEEPEFSDTTFELQMPDFPNN